MGARLDDERNLRGIHCTERGKDRKEGVFKHSTIFLVPLYWLWCDQERGVLNRFWLGSGHVKNVSPMAHPIESRVPGFLR